MTDRQILAVIEEKMGMKAEIEGYIIMSLSADGDLKIQWDRSKQYITHLQITSFRSELPVEIGELTNLVELCFLGCEFTEAPIWISTLSQLKQLSIIYCSLTSLPNAYDKLINLEILDLRHNYFVAIPSVIYKLSQLTMLRFDSNRFVLEISDDISKLVNLRHISFQKCTIRLIPYGLLKLNLDFILNYRNIGVRDGIYLRGSDLIEGDINLFRQPREVIEAYYKGQQTKIKECKLIFLGDGDAGKSSTIQRLMFNTFDDEGKKPTEGIKMLNMPLQLSPSPDDNINLRILDFGGQEIMHAMHRCFLTQKTVYIVVCESRNDSDIDRTAARWLETVKSFAPDCPVILVLNKCDLNPNISVNERSLRQINPKLSSNVIKASAKWNALDGQDNGMDRILNEIAREVKLQIDDFSSSFNKDWLGIKQELEGMARDYISYEEFLAICEKHGITEKIVQDGILNWLAPLGVAYHYRTESLTSIENFNVLSPGWLTNGMYRLILRTPENDGILSHKSIKNVLEAIHPDDVIPNITYTQQETEFILHVMRKFEISHDLGNGNELIPLKMKKDAPTSVDNFTTEGALHLSWQTGYIPDTVLHRLMIRKFPELDTNCMWRTGARFEDKINGREALVERRSEQRIDVYVNATQADECIMYLDDIRRHILTITNELNLTCKEIIHYTKDGKVGEVPYTHALQHYYDGKSEMYIEGIGYPNPADVLGRIYTKEAIMGERNINIYNGQYIEKPFESVVQINGDVIINQIAECLPKCKLPEQSIYNEIISQLNSIAQEKNLDKSMHEKINNLLEECKNTPPSSAWNKIRTFLGDTANLATISTTAALYGPPFIELLRSICFC